MAGIERARPGRVSKHRHGRELVARRYRRADGGDCLVDAEERVLHVGLGVLRLQPGRQLRDGASARVELGEGNGALRARHRSEQPRRHERWRALHLRRRDVGGRHLALHRTVKRSRGRSPRWLFALQAQAVRGHFPVAGHGVRRSRHANENREPDLDHDVVPVKLGDGGGQVLLYAVLLLRERHVAGGVDVEGAPLRAPPRADVVLLGPASSAVTAGGDASTKPPPSTRPAMMLFALLLTHKMPAAQVPMPQQRENAEDNEHDRDGAHSLFRRERLLGRRIAGRRLLR